MTKIPASLRKQLAADPFYKVCARCGDGSCSGRITWEHTVIYAGKQVQKRWAILPLCEYHHAVDSYQDGGDLDKQKNQWMALSRMTAEDRAEFPRFNWERRLDYLQRIYGFYLEPIVSASGINYPVTVFRDQHE